MIPNVYLNEWRQNAPWPNNNMVEQDLIISRLLIELFNNPRIAESLAFRGGTAIYKLFTSRPIRYSEDLDFVQIKAEAIGETINAIRSIVDPMLGKPKTKRGINVFTLTYAIFTGESKNFGFGPLRQNFNNGNFQKRESQKLKIEINTREHFSIFGWQQKYFSMHSRWFSGETKISTYDFDELLGTKIRAFYERDKGRDLFDLWFALTQEHFNPKKAIDAFIEYSKKENKNITRALFEMNFAKKLDNGFFSQDISSLLAPDIEWDFEKAAIEVFEKIIQLLPGEKWKG
jgi:predicted nucleotidyltransferase component of viral defense system